MNRDFIKIIKPQTPQEFEVYFLLRYNLLRKPWNQPLGSEKDEQENTSIHFLALNDYGNGIGVCRLQFNTNEEAQIRYMAVDDSYRNMGIGKLLISFAENMAKEKSAKQIILHARENAVMFYRKCGYSIDEKSYLMWGEIQHYLMRKEL